MNIYGLRQKSKIKGEKIICVRNKHSYSQEQCFEANLAAQIGRASSEKKMFAVLSGQNIKSQTKPSVLLRRGQASNPIFALEVGHLSLMQPKQRGACYFDIYYVNLPFKDVDVQFGSNSHYKLLLLFMLCQFLASTVNTPASDVRV